jgi:hypothetical protein
LARIGDDALSRRTYGRADEQAGSRQRRIQRLEEEPLNPGDVQRRGVASSPSEDGDAHVEAAGRRGAGRAPPPRIEYDAPLKPEMNRQERVAFTVYSVMGAAIVAFLAATLLLWWLGT